MSCRRRRSLSARACSVFSRAAGFCWATQAGLPLVLVRDGEVELLQLQFAEIVALLGGELFQLQHLDPVRQALLLEAGGQLLGLLQPIRLVAEAQAIELGSGLQQLLCSSSTLR